MSTSDFNNKVFRVTTPGRVTRNSQTTVSFDDWIVYLKILQALFDLPTSPLSAYDTNTVKNLLTVTIGKADSSMDSDALATYMDNTIKRIALACDFDKESQNISDESFLFNGLHRMKNLSDFLAIFQNNQVFGQFHWNIRRHSVYTYFGEVNDIDEAFEQLRQSVTQVVQTPEQSVEESNLQADSLAQDDSVQEQNSAVSDRSHGIGSFITPPRPVRRRENISSPSGDGTQRDVAARNHFELLQDNDELDNDEDADIDTSIVNSPNVESLQRELLETDKFIAMYEEVKSMKQSVHDKINKFSTVALKDGIKEITDECGLWIESIRSNKDEFFKQMDTKIWDEWNLFRTKMFNDQTTIKESLARVKTELSFYEALELKKLQDDVASMQQRVLALENYDVDTILQVKMRNLLQDKDFLSTIPGFSVNPQDNALSTQADGSVDDQSPLQIHTGVPADSGVLHKVDGQSTEPDPIPPANLKSPALVNSQTAFAQFRAEQNRHAPTSKKDQTVTSPKNDAPPADKDDSCYEINGIFHPLPRFTRVRANIHNMAMDNLETVHCEEVVKMTKSKSTRLAANDRTFYYTLRNSAGLKYPVTANKIISIDPDSGDFEHVYSPGYYSKRGPPVESSDEDLIDDESESSNFSDEFHHKSASTTLPYDCTVKLHKLDDIVTHWNTKPLQSNHTAADFYNALRTSVAKHNVKLRAYSDLTTPKSGLLVVEGLNPTQIDLYQQKCNDFLYQLFVKGQSKFFASDFGRVKAILTIQRDSQRGLPVLEFILKNLGPDGFQSDSTYYNPRDRLQPPTMANLTFAEYVNSLLEYSQKNPNTVTSLDLLQLVYHEVKSISDFNKLTKLLKDEIDRVAVLPVSKQRVNDDYLLENIVTTLLHTYGDDADGICNIKGPQVRFVPGTFSQVKPQMNAFKRSNNPRAKNNQTQNFEVAKSMCKACLRYHRGETDEKCFHLNKVLPLYEYLKTLPKDTRDRLVAGCKKSGEEQHKTYLAKYQKRENLRKQINRLYESHQHDPDIFQHEREELLEQAEADDPHLNDYNPNPLETYDPYTREDFFDKDDFYSDMDRM